MESNAPVRRADHDDEYIEPTGYHSLRRREKRAGVVAAEKLLAAARAQVEPAQTNDVKAQHDLIRYRMLVDEEEVSRQTRTIGQRVPTRIAIEPGQNHDLLFRRGVNVAPKVFLR